VGQSKQEYTWGKRTSKRHSLPLDRGFEGRIREMLQEDGCSSMYIQSHSCVAICMKETCHEFFQYVAWVLLWLSCILEVNYITECCLFSQVKNKQWPPWVYSWILNNPAPSWTPMYFLLCPYTFFELGIRWTLARSVWSILSGPKPVSSSHKQSWVVLIGGLKKQGGEALRVNGQL
jgi:hypothetical protein